MVKNLSWLDLTFVKSWKRKTELKHKSKKSYVTDEPFTYNIDWGHLLSAGAESSIQSFYCETISNEYGLPNATLL